MKVSLFIYIDESSDHKNYILSAVGSNSPITLDNIVHRFRKVVRNSRLSDKAKSKINNDPKERDLYGSFPEMLLKYLDLICCDFEKRQKPLRENVHICSAFYKKKDIEIALFSERRMLEVYSNLFMTIIARFHKHFNGD